MKTVVNNADRREQQRKGTHGGFVYKFRKKVDSHVFVVVAEVKRTEAWIISGWFE